MYIRIATKVNDRGSCVATHGKWPIRRRFLWVALGLFCLSGEPALATTDAQLREAIAKGVEGLERTQVANGEFQTYNCDATLTQCLAESSPWVTTFVVYSLSFVDDPRVPRIVARAAEFLRSRMEDQGLWRFWSRGDPWEAEVGPDVDDTACASQVLFRQGIPFPDNRAALLQLQDPSGRFYTWVDPANMSKTVRDLVERLKGERGYPAGTLNDVDCIANADALLYFADRGQEPHGVCTYVNQNVAEDRIPACSLYGPSRYVTFYTIVRAYEVGARCLAPSVPLIRRHLLEEQHSDGSWGDDADTACALASLMALGYRGRRLDRGISHLLTQQHADGSWGRKRFIELFHASDAVAAGFALESLAKYVRIRESRRFRWSRWTTGWR